MTTPQLFFFLLIIFYPVVLFLAPPYDWSDKGAKFVWALIIDVVICALIAGSNTP
jgi:hypothetical protein